MTYLITFACYGCHLHGGESGSVDREHNARGTFILEADPARAAAARQRMDQAPCNLDQMRRDAVLEGIQEVCTHRRWCLLAAHVRTTHVHAVVEAEVPPERVMSDFKAYASRRLNRMAWTNQTGSDGPATAARGGSGKPKHISAAIQYVVAEQGAAMSVFEAHEP